MLSRKHPHRSDDAPDAANTRADSGEGNDAPQTPDAAPPSSPQISTSDWLERQRIVERPFSGPPDVDLPMRVDMDREVCAYVAYHAKESLDAEICGVLAGNVCDDGRGLYIHVQAAIAGAAAKQASAHVTFTQETWNQIHEVLERDFRGLQIVGWYHSHPGFGVIFSEMDLFIQKNFFSSPTQIALVIDPLGGDEAVCVNTPQGIQYIDRYWIAGREKRCRVPRQENNTPGEAPGAVAPPAAENEILEKIELRLSQLIETLDRDRNRVMRFYTGIGLFICIAVVALIAYGFYSSFVNRNTPPSLRSFAPQPIQLPVQIGADTVMLGVDVVAWSVPPELNATLVELQKQILIEEAKKIEQEMKEQEKKQNNQGTGSGEKK